MKLTSCILILLFSVNAFALHLKSPSTGIDFSTQKVSTVYGTIDPALVDAYEAQILRTEGLRGPRIVLIDSPGGYVDDGQVLIDLMEKERSEGIRQVCVVTGGASSMAFNLLSHCDIRLAVPGGHAVVHKVEGWSKGRHTAKNMRDEADALDRADEPFRQLNAARMHLTLRQYDRFADAETDWSASDLLKLRYLDGIIKIDLSK